MKVRSLYRPGAARVSRTETLREAARQMREAGASCIAVMDGDRFAGIVTERDMVEAVANGVRPAEAHVDDYTNDGGASVHLDEDVTTAALKMLAIGCRHLPVLQGDRLVGTISMRDLFLLTAKSQVEGVLV